MNNKHDVFSIITWNSVAVITMYPESKENNDTAAFDSSAHVKYMQFFFFFLRKIKKEFRTSPQTGLFKVPTSISQTLHKDSGLSSVLDFVCRGWRVP